ncbi:hypothetical protein BDQ12DRAFT_693421 [Crucibulum laeve]|uniref:Uncharacterized protein n=1 Tax=Crucibulum laeve TaxID=68775 RepID=A0A5C3LG48_9AGAR|nr:hypothetical protein BDQ12DRAFT_693421 [Crucibulum laeve]
MLPVHEESHRAVAAVDKRDTARMSKSVLINMPYRRFQQYAIAISIVSAVYDSLEGGFSIGLCVDLAPGHLSSESNLVLRSSPNFWSSGVSDKF